LQAATAVRATAEQQLKFRFPNLAIEEGSKKNYYNNKNNLICSRWNKPDEPYEPSHIVHQRECGANKATL
jgi:hypothetical protein